MVKKLILIGPPGVGKTTFKEIIFEGQSATRLLNTPLEPTRGNELTVVEFKSEKIAINDLSGQELERWLTKEQDVFDHADLILIFLDVSAKWETQIEFVKDFFDLLIKWAPGAKVTIFMHKTDLIRSDIQDLLMRKMIEFQRSSQILFDFHFTSIVGKYFPKFLDIFFENVFKIHIPDEWQAQFIQNSIYRIYLILKLLYSKGEISENYLLIENNLTQENYKPIKEVLSKLLFIRESATSGGRTVLLLQKGQDFYVFLKNYFEIVTEPRVQKIKVKKGLGRHRSGDSVLGLIISDDIGRDLCMIETTPNELRDILNVTSTQSDAMVDFVSMFLSAIFSLSPTNELPNLSEFLLKGTEIDYYVIQKKPFLFIFFVNSLISISFLKETLNKLVTLIMDRFNDVFTTFKQKGVILPSIGDLKEVLKSKIQEVNNTAKQKTKKTMFDEIHGKELFLTLGELSQDPNLPFNQIKDLKKKLLGAILNKDPHELYDVDLSLTKMRKKSLGE